MWITFLKILFALLAWMGCVIVGWILTETPFRISKIKALDFAPINCKKCFTFWITICVSIFTIFVLNLTLSGIIIAVLGCLTAIAMHIEDKKLIGE